MLLQLEGLCLQPTVIAAQAAVQRLLCKEPLNSCDMQRSSRLDIHPALQAAPSLLQTQPARLRLHHQVC